MNFSPERFDKAQRGITTKDGGYNVTDLREVADSLYLPRTGTRAELLERIATEIAQRRQTSKSAQKRARKQAKKNAIPQPQTQAQEQTKERPKPKSSSVTALKPIPSKDIADFDYIQPVIYLPPPQPPKLTMTSKEVKDFKSAFYGDALAKYMNYETVEGYKVGWNDTYERPFLYMGDPIVALLGIEDDIEYFKRLTSGNVFDSITYWVERYLKSGKVKYLLWASFLINMQFYMDNQYTDKYLLCSTGYNSMWEDHKRPQRTVFKECIYHHPILMFAEFILELNDQIYRTYEVELPYIITGFNSFDWMHAERRGGNCVFQTMYEAYLAQEGRQKHSDAEIKVKMQRRVKDFENPVWRTLQGTKHPSTTHWATVIDNRPFRQRYDFTNADPSPTCPNSELSLAKENRYDIAQSFMYIQIAMLKKYIRDNPGIYNYASEVFRKNYIITELFTRLRILLEPKKPFLEILNDRNEDILRTLKPWGWDGLNYAAGDIDDAIIHGLNLHNMLDTARLGSRQLIGFREKLEMLTAVTGSKADDGSQLQIVIPPIISS